MTKDIHLISEAYFATKKKLNEQAPAPVQQPAPAATQPAAPAPTAAQPAATTQQPQQQAAPAAKATKEQEKAVNELLKAFGLPESADPYLIQSLVQNVPALKQQYGM